MFRDTERTRVEPKTYALAPTDVPFGKLLEFGTMFSVTTTVKKVEINKEVDPKIFEMPK